MIQRYLSAKIPHIMPRTRRLASYRWGRNAEAHRRNLDAEIQSLRDRENLTPGQWLHLRRLEVKRALIFFGQERK